MRALSASMVLLASVTVAVFIQSEAQAAVPAGFTEVTAFSGLQNPTAIRFAADGRVFVAEKRGVIQMYDGLADTTPTAVADLRTETYNFWDRGLLGLAVDPLFPTRPYLYALYTFDGSIGGTAPRCGTAGADTDPCPTPPGATTDGCAASGKLVRLTLDMGNPSAATTTKQDLVSGWCQQYPSHSVGDLVFGRDGSLYASGGDGASFDWVDYGQGGNPVNPCGDPPGGVGGAMTAPTAEGGALRAQDLRTPADPVGLSGTVIRVDPDTGLAMPDNPNAGAADPNAQRIVAYGLRNPFRMTTHPGTDEMWLADVGWNDTEEIDRLTSPKTAVGNFGWPCYEGDVRQSGYDAADLKICEDLYAQGTADTKPYYSYKHGQPLNANDNCNAAAGSSASGISFQFYAGGPYPAEYDGALFFSDYSRNCVWVMTKGADGLPDKLKVRPFVSNAAGPVDLEISPQGEIFYADLNGGTIRRVVYNATTPFTASRALTAGAHDVKIEYFETNQGAVAKFSWTGGTTNSPPTPTITTPASGTTWKVGDTITFSGSATDPEDGVLPASSLSWEMVLQHCPSDCHAHQLQTWSGVSGGSITAPGHEYPAYLELRLTATDKTGQTTTVSRRLDPQTTTIGVVSQPSGLQLALGSQTATAPFTRTRIVGSTASLSAPSPQSVPSGSYAFEQWSDGGAQSHNVTVGATAATYTATYSQTAAAMCPVDQYQAQYFANTTLTGTPATVVCEARR